MKHFFKKRKALIFSVLILVVFFTSFSFVFAAGSGLSWFGGNIINVTPCTCSGGSQVTIMGLPTLFSGTYLYMPGRTQGRGKKNVIAGRQILGLYSPGGNCTIYGMPICPSLPISKGTMTIIGTN